MSSNRIQREMPIRTCERCHARTRTKYDLCKACYWTERNNKGPKGYYTYIIEYNRNRYYIGHTGNITRAVYRHKHGDVETTRGKTPRLMWVRRAKDSEEAEGVRDYIRKAEEEVVYLMRWLALEGPRGEFRPGTREYYETHGHDEGVTVDFHGSEDFHEDTDYALSYIKQHITERNIERWIGDHDDESDWAKDYDMGDYYDRYQEVMIDEAH